jgi:hypothetical protein
VTPFHPLHWNHFLHIKEKRGEAFWFEINIIHITILKKDRHTERDLSSVEVGLSSVIGAQRQRKDTEKGIKTLWEVGRIERNLLGGVNRTNGKLYSEGQLVQG